jgi:hypothetical protein
MLTTFISSSLVLPIPASLAPQPGTAPSICAPPHGKDAPIQGATLLEELHTPPLPVTHVFLGYRWSHNESAATPNRQWLDNDRQSFRSCLRFDVNRDCRGSMLKELLPPVSKAGGNPSGDSLPHGFSPE